jgi:hypothetical protein
MGILPMFRIDHRQDADATAEIVLRFVLLSVFSRHEHGHLDHSIAHRSERIDP